MSEDLMENVNVTAECESVIKEEISPENEPAFLQNGYIVDVSDARKISDVIYQLSSYLDYPEAKEKQVCIKLGDLELNMAQLSSIKALVETMNSEVAFICTTSDFTESEAKEIGIKVSKLENKITTPDFDANKEGSAELEKALDKIFGGVSNEALKIKEKLTHLGKKQEVKSEQVQISQEAEVEGSVPVVDVETSSETEESLDISDDFAQYEEFNKEIELANNISAEEEEKLRLELQAKLQITEQLPTLYIQRTLRSGQTLTADGNIVIIGDVNPGSEIKAVGDITVWGILGGIAHAGIEGNQFARIRALKMNAIQLRIANIFARRPDCANIPYIQKTDTFVPEEASVDGNHIIIQKMINKL